MKVKQKKLFNEIYFQVDSGKKTYLQTLNPLKCTCKAFMFGRGQLCKHLKAVIEFLEVKNEDKIC